MHGLNMRIKEWYEERLTREFENYQLFFCFEILGRTVRQLDQQTRFRRSRVLRPRRLLAHTHAYASWATFCCHGSHSSSYCRSGLRADARFEAFSCRDRASRLATGFEDFGTCSRCVCQRGLSGPWKLLRAADAKGRCLSASHSVPA